MESLPQAGPTPHVLGYGAKGSFRKRHWIRLWGFIVATILVAVGLSRWIPTAWRATRIYYYEQQSLAHPVAPNVIVYSSTSPSVGSVSPEVARLLKAFGSPTPSLGRNATIYIGIRRAPNGLTRFIAVGADVVFVPGGGVDVEFSAVNLTTGFMDHKPAYPLLGMGGFSNRWGSNTDVSMNSAIEDPNDASHFTYMFDITAGHYAMDCWLQNDGSLKVRTTTFSWEITPAGTRGSKFKPFGVPTVANIPNPN